MPITLAAICLVIGVTDGDTMRVRCGDDKPAVVRLWGIDAPELGQPFGRASKRSLSDLCADAPARVTPVAQDRYGRTVARVQCGGQDASGHQVDTGLAWAYRRYSLDAALLSAEQSARDRRAGLWADPGAIPPWEHRRAAPKTP